MKINGTQWTLTYEHPNVIVRSGQSAVLILILGFGAAFVWPPSTLGYWQIALPQWLSVIGSGLVLVALLGMASMIPVVRAHKTPWGPQKAPTALITSAHFALARHPGDLLALAMLLGAALALQSWLLAFALVGWAVLVHVGCHHREERYLAQKFPEQWAEYAKRVKRYGFV